MPSCWCVHPTTGVCHVRADMRSEWEARLDALRAQIVYWTAPANRSAKTVEQVELFYSA